MELTSANIISKGYQQAPGKSSWSGAYMRFQTGWIYDAWWDSYHGADLMLRRESLQEITYI